MPLRSLQQRIVAVFVSLLTLVMALIMGLVMTSNQRIVASELARELTAGALVFQRLIGQNQRQLETAATVLASDFAFREAIATQDQATVGSVIRNHGLRIGAQAMSVISPDGQVMSDTLQPAGQTRAFQFPDLLTSAQLAGRSSGFRRMKDGSFYQIVLVPIQAPKLIAWVAVGFQVDDRWARDVSEMTGLTVSIVQRGEPQATLLASSLSPARRVLLTRALRDLPDEASRVLQLDHEHFQTMQMPIANDVDVVLQRSLEQAEAPFRSLQTVLLVVVLGGVMLFTLGSIMLARRIVRPINELSAAAHRIEQGDYSQPVPRLPADEIGQLASTFDHMRERVASREEKILRLAYEDSLTGLPNRTRLLEGFSQWRTDMQGAIAILNIDRFGSINNALGHPVGDRLLVEIGRRLSAITRAPALLARLWGNDFAFLLPNADEAAAADFAHAVLATLRDPITLDGQRLDVGGSIGLALHPRDGGDATTLLRRAELAMLVAKRRHSGMAFASDSGGEPAHEQLSLIGEMRDALARQEFLLDYQPKLDLASGRISGAEALLRWTHPARGRIPPGRFIPFAEQTGFIREITPWVIESAVVQNARWHREGLALVVAANLSTLDILDPHLVGHVHQLLQQHALPPQRLCLEITESALMSEPELALAHLGQLAALGVRLSIDDYGSGQASLAYLKTLPVHELKIDQSFVTSLVDASKNAAIVRSTIVLSHELGLTVTAEGAETNDVLDWLRHNGCDVAQGFGIGRPMAAAELPDWIRRFHAARGPGVVG